MKKIMFNDRYGLTQAVLEGRKTMTQRTLKVPIKDFNSVRIALLSEENTEVNKMAIIKKYAKYQVGEEVAVAQSYSNAYDVLKYKYGKDVAYDWGCNVFKTLGSIPPLDKRAGWTNKMFVRADLMPHRIRITNIKLERLQDISDDDCMKEGIMEGEFMNTWDTFYYDMWGDVPNHITFRTPRKAFANLIDRISGRGTWERNPWVFAYEFELVK